MTGTALRRLVRTAEIMGTVVSIHVLVDAVTAAVGSPAGVERPVHPEGVGGRERIAGLEEAVDSAGLEEAVGSAGLEEVAGSAVEGCFSELREIDRIFSTYRAGSDISRMRAGTLAERDADPRVALVRRACERAEAATGGLFSARWRGDFDPTGYVKGWAVEHAHDRWMRPLLARPGAIAAGTSAGGDMQLSTRPGSRWRWDVGIADPDAPGRLLATVRVTDGAVATSGTAERGAHILDPRTGRAVRERVGATVIADRLSQADVWATAAVVSGVDDLSWVASAPHTSGLIAGPGGRVRRWAAGAEIDAADPGRPGASRPGMSQPRISESRISESRISHPGTSLSRTSAAPLARG